MLWSPSLPRCAAASRHMQPSLLACLLALHPTHTCTSVTEPVTGLSCDHCSLSLIEQAAELLSACAGAGAAEAVRPQQGDHLQQQHRPPVPHLRAHRAPQQALPPPQANLHQASHRSCALLTCSTAQPTSQQSLQCGSTVQSSDHNLSRNYSEAFTSCLACLVHY